MEQASWYAIYTALRAEKCVKKRLDQAGIENYVPLRVVTLESGDRTERVEVPVFSGCMFVRVTRSDFAKVQEIAGVQAFLYERNEVLATFTDQQVASLRLLCEHAEEIDVVENETPEAHAVRVVRGNLSGLEGVVLDDASICRVLVRLPRVGNIVTIVPENSIVRL